MKSLMVWKDIQLYDRSRAAGRTLTLPATRVPSVGITVPSLFDNWNSSRSSAAVTPDVIIAPSTTVRSFLLVLGTGVVVEVQVVSVLGDTIVKKVGDRLLAIEEGLDQEVSHWLILVVVERGGEAFVPNTSGATLKDVSKQADG
jgi:hypothetical protein